MIAAAIGIAGLGALLAAIHATRRVKTFESADRRQRISLLIIIWALPFLGPIIVVSFLKSEADNDLARPERVSAGESPDNEQSWDVIRYGDQSD